MTRSSVYILFTLFFNVALGQDGFTCYPNFTIHFTNPNATIYTHHTAIYDDNGITRDCNSSADVANYNIYFYCTTTTTVTAYFTDSAIEENKLIRGTAMAYKVQCRTFTPYIKSVSEDIPVSIDEDVVTSTVEVDISAGFYYYIHKEALQADVGEQLFFTITGPAEYSLKPIQCNATGGPETGHVVVITNGFFDSDNLTLTCRVKVCPGLGCNYRCTDRTKRALSPVQGSMTGDVTISTVSGKLRIVDFAIGQSVHRRGLGSLSLVLLIVVLLT